MSGLWQRIKDWIDQPIIDTLDPDGGPSDEALEHVADREESSPIEWRPQFVFFTTPGDEETIGLATLDLRPEAPMPHATMTTTESALWFNVEPSAFPIKLWGLQYGGRHRWFLSYRGLKSAYTQLGKPEDARFFRAAVIWEETAYL